MKKKRSLPVILIGVVIIAILGCIMPLIQGITAAITTAVSGRERSHDASAGGWRTQNTGLTENILEWEEICKETLVEHGCEDYTDAALAILQVVSDTMQATEDIMAVEIATGRSVNGKEDSVRKGCAYLASLLEEAGMPELYDYRALASVFQAYRSGREFLTRPYSYKDAAVWLRERGKDEREASFGSLAAAAYYVKKTSGEPVIHPSPFFEEDSTEYPMARHQPVYSVSDGTVTRIIKEDTGYRVSVSCLIGDMYYTADYANLADIKETVQGQILSRGQVFALAGAGTEKDSYFIRLTFTDDNGKQWTVGEIIAMEHTEPETETETGR